jgi:hypothetical protein
MINMCMHCYIEVCLRCYSEVECSEVLSEALGVEPSQCFNKGDRIYGKTGKQYGLCPRTGWIIEKKYSECSKVSEVISEFLREFNVDVKFIKNARKAKFDQIELFVGIFGLDYGRDIWIDTQLCKTISELNINLGMSIYA